MVSAFVSQYGREGWRWYNDACHYKVFTVYQTFLYTSSDMLFFIPCYQVIFVSPLQMWVLSLTEIRTVWLRPNWQSCSSIHVVGFFPSHLVTQSGKENTEFLVLNLLFTHCHIGRFLTSLFLFFPVLVRNSKICPYLYPIVIMEKNANCGRNHSCKNGLGRFDFRFF